MKCPFCLAPLKCHSATRGHLISSGVLSPARVKTLCCGRMVEYKLIMERTDWGELRRYDQVVVPVIGKTRDTWGDICLESTSEDVILDEQLLDHSFENTYYG